MKMASIQGVISVPLYRRVIRSDQQPSQCRISEASNVQSESRRRAWNKGEGQRQMDLALREIADGKITIRKAALAYGIPKSTLYDHASGKVKPGAGVGIPKYLTDEEEDEVVRWLEGCAEVGCAKSIREVRSVVGAIVAKKLGVECISVSHGWWDRFRQRHPHLTMRAGEALAYRRAVAASPETLNNYFDQLEEILLSNSLYNCPSRIYNIDESGFPLQHRPGNRIAVRGQKHVVVNTSGDKTQVTVLACVSAGGCYMPPMVIFKRSDLTEDLIQGEVPDTLYGLSKSGWMDGDLFSKWFHFHFLKHAPSERPILIVLDGHSSHYNPKVIREAALAGVILFCLPPNITHIAQPLDVTPFHSLKSHWYNACDQYMSSHPGKRVTIYNFSKLFSQAWYQAMLPRIIMSGFRATGIFPFNRRAISIPGAEKSIGTPTAKLAYQQGIKYLPFHSPHHSQHCTQSSEELQQATPSQQVLEQETSFSEEEHRLFERRLEEGYDLADTRYQKWLQQRKTTSTSLELDSVSPPPDDCHHSHNVIGMNEKSKEPLWSEFLLVPSPAYRTTNSAPGKARVLTSSSFLQKLAEKEQKKKEAAEEKEIRKKEREQKRVLKEKEKEQRKNKREAKRILQKDTCKGKQKTAAKKTLQKKQPSLLSDDDQFSTQSNDDDWQSESNDYANIDLFSEGRVSSESEPVLDKVPEKKCKKGQSTFNITPIRMITRSQGNDGEKSHKVTRRTRNKSACVHGLKSIVKPNESRPNEELEKAQECTSSHVPAQKQDSNCLLGLCSHPRAVNMVQCSECSRWLHCICEGVQMTKAINPDYKFICNLCI